MKKRSRRRRRRAESRKQSIPGGPSMGSVTAYKNILSGLLEHVSSPHAVRSFKLCAGEVDNIYQMISDVLLGPSCVTITVGDSSGNLSPRCICGGSPGEHARRSFAGSLGRATKAKVDCSFCTISCNGRGTYHGVLYT